MKKNKIITFESNSMLYQKTNEDFNNEKPNPSDPTQIKAHPIEDNTTKKITLNNKKSNFKNVLK